MFTDASKGDTASSSQNAGDCYDNGHSTVKQIFEIQGLFWLFGTSADSIKRARLGDE